MGSLGRVLRPRAGTDEGGFTLVELVIAMFITLLVMSSMLGLFVSSLSTVALAKQRQTATALATQTLERLRALPYDVVKAGIRSGTAAYTSDPNLADIATPTPRFRPVSGGIDEVLVTSSSQVTPPLSLHRVPTTVANVTYTVGIYVTQAGTPQPAYNLTALVTFQSSVSRGAKSIIQRSTSFSPSGCLSTANHPFSGPCQAAFSALGKSSPGGVTVSNPTGSDVNIQGFGGTEIGIDVASTSATTTVEQTTTLVAGARTSAATQTVGGVTGTSGAQNASASADSDPSSSAAAGSATSSAPSQTIAVQSLTGLAGTLSATPNSTDTGAAASQVIAGATGCVNSGGATIASGQPCASSSVHPQGAASTVTYNLGGASPLRSMPTFTLASVAPASGPTRAVAGRFTIANGSTCTVAVPNCAHAGIRRVVGDVAVGGLPARVAGDLGPAAYTNAFTVTGLVESARAESGTGSSAPALSRTAGTLAYWNGATYTSLALSTVTADQAIDPPSVTMTYTHPSGRNVVITADTDIRLIAPRTTIAIPALCQPLACTAEATSAGTLRAQTLYTVTFEGLPVTSFVVSTDLGGLNAESSFRAAPLA